MNNNQLKILENPTGFIDGVNRFYIFNRFEENYGIVYTTFDIIEEYQEDNGVYCKCLLTKSNGTGTVTLSDPKETIEKQIEAGVISNSIQEAIENFIAIQEKGLKLIKEQKEDFFSHFNINS